MPAYCLLSVITAFLAMITDLASSRIPNVLMAVCLLSGIGERIFRLLCGRDPWEACTFPEMITGFFLPVVILSLPFMLKGLGAGDVKLFCVLGSLMGSRRILACMEYSFAAAGVEAVVLLAIRRNRKEKLHFAVPVFAGTCICCFWKCCG